MRLYLNDKEVDHIIELLGYGLNTSIKTDNPDIDQILIKRIEKCRELQTHLTRAGR